MDRRIFVCAMLVLAAIVAGASPVSGRKDPGHESPPKRATTRGDVEGMLERVMPELRCEQVAIDDVLGFLRDVSGANIVVHWDAITAATGVTPATLVTIKAKNITFGKAIEAILDNVTNHKGKPQFSVVGPAIAIGTPASLKNLSDLYARHQNDPKEPAELRKAVPELKLEAIALTDTIDFLRDLSGAGFQLDWAGLEKAGVQKTTQVTVRLRNVPFTDALVQILGSLPSEVDYQIDGRIKIFARGKPATTPHAGAPRP